MSNIWNAAHSDGQNQVFSQIGVIGTLGTADTKGTALTLPVGVDPFNGAQYVHALTGDPTAVENGSYVLSYDASGNLGTVNLYLNGGTYTKILSYDASNNLGTVSAWA